VDERLGVVGRRPAATDGRVLLTISDGTWELVDPDLSDDELKGRYGLDRIEHFGPTNFCKAVHLDGPLAGQTGYATNRLGARVGFRQGDVTGTYEVVELAEDDRAAGLRFVG
jgi:hypothetical protein